jgi:hypothetical protein
VEPVEPDPEIILRIERVRRAVEPVLRNGI